MSGKIDPGLLDFANGLADTAGGILRRYFRRGVAVDDKADLSPVTIADREAEAALRAAIERAYPEDGILGEEHGAVRVDARRVWVIDPIDGTKSFISGVPLFGTLIALVEASEPVLGVIDQPISRERWVGARGHASTLNGAPIRTRACGSLAAATLFSTTPDMFKGADADSFQRLRSAVKLARFGGDCYAYGLLAAGFIDLVVEASLKPYDFLAMVTIIEGAGGRIVDWEGRKLGLGSDGRVLGCGDPGLLASARACLKGAS